MKCTNCDQVFKQTKYDSHIQRCRAEAPPPPRPLLGRSVQEWEEIFPRYPVTQDGYAVSYASSQPQEYLPLLLKYGFCVVKVLSKKECDVTIRAMFEDLNQLQNPKLAVSKLDPQNPSTWERENWPNPDGKFLTNVPTFCEQAWKNRLHPAVSETFEHIYGTSHLVTSIDNWGIFRGTRNLVVKGETVNRPEWSTELPIHWHIDPWNSNTNTNEGYSGSKYMALVSLTDSKEEVGGHLTVPGSTAHLATWAAENAALRPKVVKPTLYVPTGAIFKRYTQKIPLRKGEMIIWDMRQAHGAFPNHSSHMRLYQFIRYIPADLDSQTADKFSPLNVFARHPDQKNSEVLKSVLNKEKDWYIAGLRSYPTEAKLAGPTITASSAPSLSSTQSSLSSSNVGSVSSSSSSSSSSKDFLFSTVESCSPKPSASSSTKTIAFKTIGAIDEDEDDDDDDDNELFFEDEMSVMTSDEDDDDDDTDFEMNEKEENFAAVEAVRISELSEGVSASSSNSSAEASRLNSLLLQLSPVTQVKSNLVTSNIGKLIGAGSLIVAALTLYQKFQRGR